MSNFDYTLWPNANGNLGEIKVQIPTGTDNDTIKWPAGDALVGNFVYNKGNLVGFVDTKALVANSSKTSTLPYDYVNISLPSITKEEMTFSRGERCKFASVTYSNGETEEMFKYKGCKTADDVKSVDGSYETTDVVDGTWIEPLKDLEKGVLNLYSEGMFYSCTNLKTFDSDLSSLKNGSNMFYSCTNLKTFDSDLSNLTNGYRMFSWCDKLTEFISDLGSLTNGYRMFSWCDKLTEFISDLGSLTNGEYMFQHSHKFTTFASDLSSLTNGHGMFWACWGLTSFNSNLSNLTCGSNMFYYCTNLTSFNSDLSSLMDGTDMFSYCKLDTPSIKNIAETINTSIGRLDIGIGHSSATTEELTYFQQIRDKDWELFVQFNSGDSCGTCGTCATCCASLATLDENGEETSAPVVYWAKPIPATEETARYIDEQGNYYNILGGNLIYVNDPDTYGMFINRQDAANQMRLRNYVKGEEPTDIIETA